MDSLFGSLRTRLALWFGGLSLFTLLSVGLYTSQLVMQQMAQEAGEALYSSATAAADLIGANLRERELEITLLSQAPQLTTGKLDDPEVQRTLDRQIEVRTEFAWLGIADADGLVVQAVNGMLRNQSVTTRPWFIAGAQGVHVGDVHEAVLLAKLLPALASGEPLRFIDFAAPIHAADGRLLGVLGAHAHWSWVTETISVAAQRRDNDKSVDIMIVNKDGKVLYPEPEGDARLPADIPADQHFTRVTWHDGLDYLVSQVAVEAQTHNDLGWRIVVRQPLDTALAPAQALRERLLILGCAVAIGFALLALRLARNISQPIEQLVVAAHEIAQRQGKPKFPAHSSLREVRHLSRSMQAMTNTLLARERDLESINETLEEQVRERTEALAASNLQLESLATHDALTGLHNRRRFDEKLPECMDMAKRTGRGFSLLMLDADHFKRVNDNHGHKTGDAVLQQLARLIVESTRTTDFVARYGGEEFVVILPETPRQADARAVAEKIRMAVESAIFPNVGQVTVSIGISHGCPDELSHPDTVVQQADRALYEAKAMGRNRVVAFSPSASSETPCPGV